jgi:hypothetical protein
LIKSIIELTAVGSTGRCRCQKKCLLNVAEVFRVGKVLVVIRAGRSIKSSFCENQETAKKTNIVDEADYVSAIEKI